MTELNDAVALLEELEKKEKELEQFREKLTKKDLASHVNSLQTLVIKYQRGAVEVLLRILKEREEVGKLWEDLVNGTVLARESMKSVEALLREGRDKKLVDLQAQIEARDKVIANLGEEVSILKARVKSLLGV